MHKASVWCPPVRPSLCLDFLVTLTARETSPETLPIFRQIISIWNESVPKITINNTINLFSKTAISVLLISNHNSFQQNCFQIFCLKHIFLVLEMASPGNQHCASCIGTLSFPIYTCLAAWRSGVRHMNEVNQRRAWLVLGWVTVFVLVYHLGM